MIMFPSFFSFTGRLGKQKYINSFLIYLAAVVIFRVLMFNIVGFVFFLPFQWFILAQGAKRNHDIGNPGWYALIPFNLLVILFKKGDPMQNSYGSSEEELAWAELHQEEED